MKKETLLAFNDAVIAIIMTLMVLEIKLPGLEGGEFRAMFLHVGVYAISFVIASIFWLNIHAMLEGVMCVSSTTVWLNLSLLFLMSLIPLPTEALGENPHARPAHLFFGSVMFACGVMYALLHLAVSPDLEKVAADAKAYLNWKNWGSTLLMGASLPLAFVSTWISLVIFIAVPALYFLPSRHLVREE